MTCQSEVRVTFECDIGDCTGNGKDTPSCEVYTKPPGDPALLPQGWVRLNILNLSGAIVHTLDVCARCYPSVLTRLGVSRG